MRAELAEPAERWFGRTRGRGQSSGSGRGVGKKSCSSSRLAQSTRFLRGGRDARRVACCRRRVPAPAPAAARIFGARGKRIQSLYPISRLGSIVISGLFYHRKHTKLDGAIVVHRYIRYIVISGIVISGFDCINIGRETCSYQLHPRCNVEKKRKSTADLCCSSQNSKPILSEYCDRLL